MFAVGMTVKVHGHVIATVDFGSRQEQVAWCADRRQGHVQEDERSGGDMTALRKHTKFVFCDRHAGWFSGATRYRRIECMVEGGPGSMTPGCEGGKCRLWPGTDIFEASVCKSEMALEWTEEASGAVAI